MVVGHSFGGLVALALAEADPDFAAALVLIAPIAFPEPRPLEHLLLAPRAAPFGGPAFSMLAQATFDRPLLKMIQRQMFAPQAVPPEWEAHYPHDAILTPAAMVAQGEDFTAMLPMSPAATIDFAAVRAPVTILAGTSDRIVNPAVHARPLAALLRSARLIELEGIGHMPHHVAADDVVQAIRGSVAAALPHSSAR